MFVSSKSELGPYFAPSISYVAKCRAGIINQPHTKAAACKIPIKWNHHLNKTATSEQYTLDVGRIYNNVVLRLVLFCPYYISFLTANIWKHSLFTDLFCTSLKWTYHAIFE